MTPFSQALVRTTTIPHHTECGPAITAHNARLRRFHGADTVTPIDARVGWRPIPADGKPIVGFTPDAPGLYLAVMHAGVAMAPVVGRLATGEIVAGNEAEALAPCRVSRFG